MPSHAVLLLLMLSTMPCMYSKRVVQSVSEEDQTYIKVDTQSNSSRNLLKVLKRANAVGSAKHHGGKLPKGLCTSIKQHPYKKGAFIQKGGFGKVYHATACNSNDPDHPLVIKEVRYKRCSKQPSECDGKEYGFDPVEIKPMLLKLPFVADLEAVYYDKSQDQVTILNRYYQGGDMIDYYDSLRGKPDPDLATIKVWGAQIAYALWMMHRSRFIYGDLKLDNMFVVEPKGSAAKRLVISDFGLSTENCGPTTCTKRPAGTLELLSPQIVEQKLYGYEVDWWALGIVLANMAGEFPYTGDGNAALFAEISKGRPHFSRSIDSELREYLSKVLSKDQYVRRLATDTSRKLMVSDKASDHPILKDPFWHGQTDPSKIEEYWQQICKQYSLQPAKCGLSISVPDQKTSYADVLCPSCQPEAACEADCNIAEAKKKQVCNAVRQHKGCKFGLFHIRRSTRERCCACLVSHEDAKKQICGSR